jgi:hypothetical protein
MLNMIKVLICMYKNRETKPIELFLNGGGEEK